MKARSENPVKVTFTPDPLPKTRLMWHRSLRFHQMPNVRAKTPNTAAAWRPALDQWMRTAHLGLRA